MSNASSEAYDMAGGPGPGNPVNLLFPTNFARLALGPTVTPTAKYVCFASHSDSSTPL